MGLNHISIAAVITLLGAASALHAETAPPAENPPSGTAKGAPAPIKDDPAFKASPIASTSPAAPAPAAQDATTPTPPAPEATAPAQPSAPTKATAPATTKGDVLKMPKKGAAPKKKKAPSTPVKIEADGMPGRGATMAQVEQRFGAPREKLSPVGKPPITRWIYPNYTVYFEYEYVIDSVRSTPAGAHEQTAPMTAPQQPAAPATEAAPAPGPEAAPAPAEPAMPGTAAPGEASPDSGQ